jgi:hypothetical protein
VQGVASGFRLGEGLAWGEEGLEEGLAAAGSRRSEGWDGGGEQERAIPLVGMQSFFDHYSARDKMQQQRYKVGSTE